MYVRKTNEKRCPNIQSRSFKYLDRDQLNGHPRHVNVDYLPYHDSNIQHPKAPTTAGRDAECTHEMLHDGAHWKQRWAVRAVVNSMAGAADGGGLGGNKASDDGARHRNGNNGSGERDSSHGVGTQAYRCSQCEEVELADDREEQEGTEFGAKQVVDATSATRHKNDDVHFHEAFVPT